MKAMILAAGFGTRLGEIGRSKAKCLVQAGSKSMLEYVVENLKRAGVSELVINLHHLGDQIREFVSNHDNFGLTVHFSPEAEILGTGGGIFHAREWLEKEECFIVHNGDIFSELDLTALLTAQRADKPLATLAVMQRKTARPLLFDASGSLCGWRGEKEEGRILKPEAELSTWAFSGIQVLSPRIFELMKSQQAPFSTISTYMLAAEQGLKVKSFDMSGSYWIDIGTPERLEELRARVKR